MNKHFHFRILAAFAVLMLSAAADLAQQSSGGDYSIEQSVIASGGGTSSDAGNNFSLSGTVGQSIAGAPLSGGDFSMRSGFWQPAPLAPTAAPTRIRGRVLDMSNNPIKNVYVSLSGGSLTAPRVVRTNNFGNFTFDNVESGQFYIISVSHGKYGFSQNTQAFSLMDELTNVVFRADWAY
jgi:hypothetical protein